MRVMYRCDYRSHACLLQSRVLYSASRSSLDVSQLGDVSLPIVLSFIITSSLMPFMIHNIGHSPGVGSPGATVTFNPFPSFPVPPTRYPCVFFPRTGIHHPLPSCPSTHLPAFVFSVSYYLSNPCPVSLCRHSSFTSFSCCSALLPSL